MSDKSNDKPESLIDRLNRRRARVAAESRGEVLPPIGEPEDPNQEKAAGAAKASPESDADDALSEAELLEKYDLPDPETIEDEAGLDRFFQGDMPERLRRMALRRVWRLNPLFRFADEMVEYGEDYTDAATVVDGLQTAYQVGKGYLQKAKDKLDEMSGDEVLDGDATAPVNKGVGSAAGEDDTSRNDVSENDSAESDVAGNDRRQGPENEAATASLPDEPRGELPAKENEDILPQPAKELSQEAGNSVLVDAPSDDVSGEKVSPEGIEQNIDFYQEKQPLKPKRMAFKRPT